MLNLATPALLAALSSSLAAQMSGSYLVDPAGGVNTFPSITAAVNALFVNGVGGPVEVLIAPGTYQESVLFLPIPGASATNTVMLRSQSGPGTVAIDGTSADTFAMLGTASMRCRWWVFDGFDFVSGPRSAIVTTSYVLDIEVRNCTFAAGFGNSQIDCQGNNVYSNWKIHHNHFGDPGQTFSIRFLNGGSEIHDNTFDFNGSPYCILPGYSGIASPNKIYNNLFRGSLMNTSGVARVIQADYFSVNEIVNNTFLVNIPNQGCCLYMVGLGLHPAIQNTITGNLFFLSGSGIAIVSQCFSCPAAVQFVSDGNLFWAPGGQVGGIVPYGTNTPVGYVTLPLWQAASGQDLASINADPLFVNGTTAPFDLHTALNSPGRNVSVGTPSYVTGDFDGRLRDAQPDIGAYEGTNLEIFGDGCPGSGTVVPTITGSGQAAIGSTTFTVDLRNALPTSFALLVGGVSHTTYGSIALPYGLGGSCSLLASVDATLGMATSVTGTATAPLRIPNNGALVGSRFYFQWFVVDVAARSRYGVAVSNAGALQL